MLNSTLKQFWEIENVQSPHNAHIVRIEDQLAMKKVENTLSFENQMYRVGILWKSVYCQIITRWFLKD